MIANSVKLLIYFSPGTDYYCNNIRIPIKRLNIEESNSLHKVKYPHNYYLNKDKSESYF